jgi:hypothetical protein
MTTTTQQVTSESRAAAMAVYDGGTMIGYFVRRGRKVEAFIGFRDETLGLFENDDAAMWAVYHAARSRRSLLS